MTGFGKTFVFLQFMLSICLLGLGVGVYSNHIDWEAEIKGHAKRISDLAGERDRAEARWNEATARLVRNESELPFRKKLFDQKLALIANGPPDKTAPGPAVTELLYVKSPEHALPYFTNDPGILNVTGGKPVQNRGADVQFYAKIQEDLEHYNARKPDQPVTGLIPLEQDRIAKLQVDYAKLTEEINGNQGINLNGLRKDRELQEIAKAKALEEQEFLKPMLANRYAETVLLLKRQNSLLARKAELDKVGVAAK